MPQVMILLHGQRVRSVKRMRRIGNDDDEFRYLRFGQVCFSAGMARAAGNRLDLRPTPAFQEGLEALQDLVRLLWRANGRAEDVAKVMPICSFRAPFESSVVAKRAIGTAAQPATSGFGREYDLDGQVQLPGVDHTADAALRLAAFLAGVSYRVKESQRPPRRPFSREHERRHDMNSTSSNVERQRSGEMRYPRGPLPERRSESGASSAKICSESSNSRSRSLV